jgi:hypothetical protein
MSDRQDGLKVQKFKKNVDRRTTGIVSIVIGGVSSIPFSHSFKFAPVVPFPLTCIMHTFVNFVSVPVAVSVVFLYGQTGRRCSFEL